MADRHELVQRVDDRRIGQRVLDLPQHVVAEEHRVLQVHDVGLDRLQERPQMLGVELLVVADRAEGPVVVVQSSV